VIGDFIWGVVALLGLLMTFRDSGARSRFEDEPRPWRMR
jgi:hypothetical protein